MSDFVVGSGIFGRDGGRFSTPSGPAKSGAPGSRPKHFRKPIPDLGDALKLNLVPHPKRPEPPAKTESPIPTDPKDLERQATGDRLIRGYIDFLKSLDLSEEGALDPEKALKQADDLVRTVTGGLGISEDEIEELTITSEFTLAEVYAAYAETDGNSARAGIFAGAAVSGRLTADIRTRDGREFHVEIEVEAAVAVQVNVGSEGIQQADPLTLDLDGDGVFSLTDVAGGALFDINADGAVDRTAFVRGADAFLALDRNENGIIDDGGELFGDQHGSANGFEELRRFDGDGNGIIDENDAVYEKLRALRRLETGELVQTSLRELDINYLSLAYNAVKIDAEGGNKITEVGQIFRSSMSYSMADIQLGYRTLSTEA